MFDTFKAIKIIKDTLDAASELNNSIKYSMVLKSWKKNNYSPKRERAFNRLREDTALGTSGDRTLCSNYWTVKGVLLQAF